MKVLNLYAGIGGNRKNWDNSIQVTAVENNRAVADAYRKLFPQDTVIVCDAHQFLIDNYSDYDVIWSSPPCPTHSKASTALKGWGVVRYPDMRLYEEIIFLRHFFSGPWVVENVKPYYEPLLEPAADIDRHYFWSNAAIEPYQTNRAHNVNRATKEILADHHGITLPPETKDARKLLRNAVNPDVGAHVLKCITHPQSPTEEK